MKVSSNVAQPRQAKPDSLGTTASSRTDLRVDPSRLARCLAVIITILITTGALANYAVYNIAPHPDHPVADVLKRFDLGHEPSIPAFYSSTMMLVSSVLLLLLGRFDVTEHTGKRRRYWYALALLFVCLAIDETVMFHEMATAGMDRLNLSGPFYFSWIVPGALISVLVGVLLCGFLLELDRKTRRQFVFSGVVFLSGALGMEFVAGLIFDAAESEEAAIRSMAHVIVQAIEEALEMAGVAIFCCALVDYANRQGIGITVHVDRNSQVPIP